MSEAELAWDWWSSGAHVVGGAAGDTQARRRVLLSVALGLLDGQSLISVATQDPSAVATLIADGVLAQISTDRVKFEHDLFADWAIACALSEDPQRTKTMPLNALPPFWLSRGFEFACRRLAESDDNDAWPAFIKDLEGLDAKSGWTALALLALVRSEHARLTARTARRSFARRPGRACGEPRPPRDRIARTARRDGAQGSAAPRRHHPQGPDFTGGPAMVQAHHVWCLGQFDRLPPSALEAAISLFEGWPTLAALGEKTLSPLLLDRLADVLIVEIEEHDRPLPKPGEALPDIKYAAGRDALETARYQLALYARSSPDAATRYLSAIAKSRQSSRWMLQLLEFPGNLASAAPAAFCEAFLNSVKRDEEHDAYRRERRYRTPSMLDSPFVLGRCGTGLFIDLLAADQKSAINLIRGLVAMDEGPTKSNDGFVLTLAGQERRPISELQLWMVTRQRAVDHRRRGPQGAGIFGA